MGVGRSGGDIGNDISSTAFFGEAKPQATLWLALKGAARGVRRRGLLRMTSADDVDLREVGSSRKRQAYPLAL
jgi:hypothetical protein